jgi:ATP-dependent RNA helicase UAP56/SUB2
MGEVKDNDYEEELVDFEDDNPKAPDSASARPLADAANKFVSFHSFPFFFVSVFFSFGYVFCCITG